MSSEPKINIEITGDTAGAKKAFSDTTASAEKMASDVTKSGDDTAKGMSSTQKSMSSSLKGVAVDLGMAAGMAMAVYNNFDRIEESALRVDKAHLNLSKKIQDVGEKQKAANEALDKFGKDSPQYVKAVTDLQQANDGLQIAQGLSKESEDNLTRAYINAASTSIPMIITAVGNLKDAYAGLKGAAGGAASAVSSVGGGGGALGALGGASIAAPIAVGAIAAYGMYESATIASAAAGSKEKESMLQSKLGLQYGQTIQTPYGPQVVGGGNKTLNMTINMTDVVNAKDPTARKEFSRLIAQDVGSAINSGIEP